MTVIRKPIGRLPLNLGDYDSTRVYGKKNRVFMYGCEWESKVENNTYEPAALDTQAGTITPDTTHWKLVSGSYATWLVDHGYKGINAGSVTDHALGMSQSAINQLLLGDAIRPALSATPAVVFVGVQSTISLSATINTNAEITIKKVGSTLKTGSGTSLSHTDTITPSSGGNIGYSADFTVGTTTKTANRNVAAVYPIRIGSGSSYVDGTPLSTPKTSPAGTYNINVASAGSYVYFNVPSTMSINGATMSGFSFPLEAPTGVTIDGVSYKSYRSSNTYDSGTLTIVIS